VTNDGKSESREDLRRGVRVRGIVRNVTPFGTFVDIGVSKDALLNDGSRGKCLRGEKGPASDLKVGMQVEAFVARVERGGKISLTMSPVSAHKERDDRQRRKHSSRGTHETSLNRKRTSRSRKRELARLEKKEILPRSRRNVEAAEKRMRAPISTSEGELARGIDPFANEKIPIDEGTNGGIAQLFVGGLPFSYGDVDVFELFQKYGSVYSTTIARDRRSGRSRGHAFVNMASLEAARNAIGALNGRVIKESYGSSQNRNNGRMLRVELRSQGSQKKSSRRKI